jgi:uncharacterized protein (TIGR02145 family)
MAIGTLMGCAKNDEEETEPTYDFETVTIGNQTWMVKNLDVVTYRNGDPISHLSEDKDWLSAKGGGWCAYNNDTSYIKNLGRIYNWHTVNDPRGIAPEGWRVATNADWQTLIRNLGGVDSAGAKLKETGFQHWAPPNLGATNASGFSAYSGGYRSETDGSFKDLGGLGIWWLNSEGSQGYAYTASLVSITEKAYTGESLKNFGAYVRCIKN